MKFFKKLQESILGSINEDLNSALQGKQMLFNSKISGALDDLISMKTGIQISKIPTKITEEAALMAERRRKEIKLQSPSMDDVKTMPTQRSMMRFPTDDADLRYVDNWIVFRSIPRAIDAHHMSGDTHEDIRANDGIDITSQTVATGYKQALFGGDLYQTTKTEWRINQRDCSIALYFPSGVKDTISVEYEAKDFGIGANIMGGIFGQDDPEQNTSAFQAMGDGFSEAWRDMKESMTALNSLQDGASANNPKFTNYTGVSLRDHTYTFQLNPYNERDAEEITDIIYWFKLLSLPTASFKNPRIKILPSEWEINFKGPIEGQIEAPQNCFLKTVDVDYSGGKDMSFIEKNDAQPPRTPKGAPRNDPEAHGFHSEALDKTTESFQHYPNGVTLTLTFQEILQIDRHRYHRYVAARGNNESQDVLQELRKTEMSDLDAKNDGPTEDVLPEGRYRSTPDGLGLQSNSGHDVTHRIEGMHVKTIMGAMGHRYNVWTDVSGQYGKAGQNYNQAEVKKLLMTGKAKIN